MKKESIQYRYELYIGATAAKVWKGLVDSDMTKQYVHGTRLKSKLEKGAQYAYLGDGDFNVVDGKILEIEPEKRLVMTWSAHWGESVANDRASRVTYELAESAPGATKLSVLHDDFDGETATYTESVVGWPLILSGLKTLLETGKPLPTR
jgi:uncharacterized protein YndB with AHSA1/START domain